MLGREVFTPVTLIGQPQNEPIKLTVPYVTSFRNAMREAQNRIRESSHFVARTQKMYFDKHVKGHMFAINQHVWLYWPRPLNGQKNKKILQIILPLVVKIQHTDGTKFRQCTLIVWHPVIFLYPKLNKTASGTRTSFQSFTQNPIIFGFLHPIPHSKCFAYLQFYQPVFISPTLGLAPSTRVSVSTCRRSIDINWTMAHWSFIHDNIRFLHRHSCRRRCLPFPSPERQNASRLVADRFSHCRRACTLLTVTAVLRFRCVSTDEDTEL